MRLLLLIATVAVVYAADEEAKVEVDEELKPEESSHAHHMGHSFSDGLELMRHREQIQGDLHQHVVGEVEYENADGHHGNSHRNDGPVILRTPSPLPHDGHPDIHAQNKIIADVFSPDFYQPTWVLDYRYLKTGGRDYTRGPGGQILILPKGVRSKEPKQFHDYDAYLEHLRLSRLSEQQHHSHGHGGHHGHNDYVRHDEHDYGYNQHERGYHGRQRHDHGHGGHGQTMWQKY